jgi:hypothetical protein
LKIAKMASQGDQARTQHKMAEVQAARGFVSEAKHLQLAAEATRQGIDWQKEEPFDGTDAAWDSLVCIFWR